MTKKPWLVDFITAFHIVWACLMIISLPLVLFWPQYDFYIFLAIGLTFASWLFLDGCILTTWEVNLRKKYEPAKAGPLGEGLFEDQWFFIFLKKYFKIDVPRLAGNITIGLYLGLTFLIVLVRII